MSGKIFNSKDHSDVAHIELQLIDDDYCLPAPIIWDVTVLGKKHEESSVSFQGGFMNTLILPNVSVVKFETFTHFEIQRGICTFLHIFIVGGIQISHIYTSQKLTLYMR